jgi:hypothetical protein
MEERRWYLFKLYIAAEPDELERLTDAVRSVACPREDTEHRCDRDWAMPCFELIHLDDPGHEDEVAWQMKFVALPHGAEGSDDESTDPDLSRIRGMVA